MNLGLRLKKSRLKLKMTQSEVCHHIISVTHYSNIEKGRYYPSDETLKLLARRLSTPFEYLSAKDRYSSKTQLLLEEFLVHIDKGNHLKTKLFKEENRNSLNYISSYEQEFYFLLLNSYWHYMRDENFTEFFRKEILEIMDEATFLSFSRETKGFYYYIEGLYYFVNNQFLESLHGFHKAISNLKGDQFQAKLHYNIALSYYNLFNYISAKTYAEEAYKRYLQLHNWLKAAGSYNLIAISNRLLGNLDIAEVYLKKALDIAEKEQDLALSAIFLHNLSAVYRDSGQYELALKTINECITFKETLHINPIISYQAKLKILLLLGDHDGFNIQLQSIQNSEMTEIQYSTLIYLEAQMAFNVEDFSTYEKLMQSSISLFKKHHILHSLEDAALHFANYFESKKQYKKAYEYSELCIKAMKQREQLSKTPDPLE